MLLLSWVLAMLIRSFALMIIFNLGFQKRSANQMLSGKMNFAQALSIVFLVDLLFGGACACANYAII